MLLQRRHLLEPYAKQSITAFCEYLMRLRLFLLLPGLLLCASQRANGIDNWPAFRGPNATGVIEGKTQLPTSWSETEHIEWKSDIPGRGWSSPVVWGNRIFLTTAVNDGDSEAIKKGLYFGGDRPQPPRTVHRRMAICLDLQTGNQIWMKQLHEGVPQTAIHIKSSYASETPVTDGEYLYVLFGGVGVYCLDFDGNEVWKREIKPRKTRNGWGYAASPVLHDNQLIIVNDNDEDSYVTALDKATGDELWKVAREEPSNWSTPFVWTNKQRTEIITPGTGKVRSYDLNGKLLWEFSGMSSITIATPYESEGLLYVSSGYVMSKKRPLYAIRAGGTGDISLQDDETSNSAIAWCQPTAAPYNPSTVLYNGIVYALLDFGFMAAYDATTGEEIYGKQRIPKGRAFTSSPWAYDGKIFCLNEDGVTFVVKAGRAFEILGTNELGSGDMGMATPAIAGDRLLIRTAERIYSIKNG